MRGPSLSLHSTLLNQYTSEEEEEEEQEALLSREYGEATEESTSNNSNHRSNKRSIQQTDAEIAKALNAKSGTESAKINADGTAAAERKRRKRMMILGDKKLTGTKGLIYIRREFPTKLHYKQPKKQHHKSKHSRMSKLDQKKMRQSQFYSEVDASAKYISTLMKAYGNFAVDLAPNMHPTDTFNKIQDLGSKKVVRDYLDNMREEVCKEHLKKVYGAERSEKLMSELEFGIQAHQEKLLNGDNYDDDEQNANDANLSANNLRASRGVGVLVENDEGTDNNDANVTIENNNNDDNRSETLITNQKLRHQDQNVSHENLEEQIEQKENISNHYLLESEEEMEFEDNDDRNTKTVVKNHGLSHTDSNGNDEILEEEMGQKNNSKDQSNDDLVDRAEEVEFADVDKPIEPTPMDQSQTTTNGEDDVGGTLDKNDNNTIVEAIQPDPTATKSQECLKTQNNRSDDDENDQTNSSKEDQDSNIIHESVIENCTQFSDSFDQEKEKGIEPSMIVEFSQTQETETQEMETFESVNENRMNLATMTQMSTNALSFSNDQLVVDGSQDFEDTQTIVPSMTPGQDFDETQTIVPSMTQGSLIEQNRDFISQEY
jgi:hypothetical protein